MMEPDKFADYEDFFLPQRDRLPSDTCMSSCASPVSEQQPSFPEENYFEASLMIETESLSDNLIDAAAGTSCIKDTTCSLENDDNQEINMVVGCDESVLGGAACCPDNNNNEEESDNLISNLRPVQVPTSSNEDSISESSTAVDEEKLHEAR